jgi:hypothetical protein
MIRKHCNFAVNGQNAHDFATVIAELLTKALV